MHPGRQGYGVCQISVENVEARPRSKKRVAGGSGRPGKKGLRV